VLKNRLCVLAKNQVYSPVDVLRSTRLFFKIYNCTYLGNVENGTHAVACRGLTMPGATA